MVVGSVSSTLLLPASPGRCANVLNGILHSEPDGESCLPLLRPCACVVQVSLKQRTSMLARIFNLPCNFLVSPKRGAARAPQSAAGKCPLVFFYFIHCRRQVQKSSVLSSLFHICVRLMKRRLCLLSSAWESKHFPSVLKGQRASFLGSRALIGCATTECHN